MRYAFFQDETIVHGGYGDGGGADIDDKGGGFAGGEAGRGENEG